MKVLTVRQPWAGLIARGLKDVENRTWAPSLALGDRFAIHAGRWDDAERLADLGDVHDTTHEAFTSGLIVCTVRLVDVTRDSRSPWAVDGHYHWVLDRPKRVTGLSPVRGRLGLWELPDFR